MNKKGIVELREELLNEEISFMNLDNKMMASGYYSVFNDGVTEDIKADGSVCYTALDTKSCEVIISFEITIDNAEDEADESFYMRVLNIESL